MPKVSIVIPMYHEQDNVAELYARLTKALAKDFPTFSYEIIFVDDGSLDLTAERVTDLHKKDSRVTLISFSRNFGHHYAITAGLDYADGDYVVMMDGDLQDQPEEIITLYRALDQGYDVVFGDRIVKQFSWIRLMLSRLFLVFIQKLVDQKIVINTTIFRIMTKQVVDELKKLRETHRYIVGVIGWVGFRHGSVPVVHGKRVNGITKYNLRKQIRLALDAIFSFSDYPLRLITRFGFLLVLVSGCMVSVVIFRKIFYGSSVLGWSSLMSAVFFMGGIQMFLMGVIGEYVGRTYAQVKNRPLYVIRVLLKARI